MSRMFLAALGGLFAGLAYADWMHQRAWCIGSVVYCALLSNMAERRLK